MTKLETCKDSSEAVKTRRVGSIPWGLYLGTSLMVHSVYVLYNNEIQKPDKDIGSMPKKTFNNFRIASLDGQMQSCVLVIGHCIDVFTLGNNSIDDADVTFLGSYVNTPRSLSVE